MNLKKIRDDGLASKLLKQANIGNNIQHDQTVLNETCKCGLLPQEFGAPVD
jgi:lipopolysaccharide biosynthesis glycosyltransferase